MSMAHENYRRTRHTKPAQASSTLVREADDAAADQLKSRYRRGDVLPILCKYCREVFEFEIPGPGRWPTLCPDCRLDPEAKYFTRRRKR